MTTIEQLLTTPVPVTVVSPEPAAPPAAIAVLHIINGEHYAGAERVQDLLGQQLPNFGYRPGFACLKNGQFAAMRKSADAPLYDAAMSSRADFSPVKRLSRIVRGEGYRLLHTHTARSALIGCAVSWRTGVPMVHHVHSPTSCDTTHRWRNWMNCLVERIVLRRARAIIAVSEAVGGYVRQQGFGVHVVPNGVPRRQAVPPRDPAKRDWTLGAIALFRPRKGLEVLLEALAELRRRGLPVRLRAVGTFETPEYEAQIRRLGRPTAVGCGHRLDRICATSMPRWPAWISSSCRASSGRACRWSCWRRCRPDCRWWPAPYRACPRRSATASRACWSSRRAGGAGRCDRARGEWGSLLAGAQLRGVAAARRTFLRRPHGRGSRGGLRLGVESATLE